MSQIKFRTYAAVREIDSTGEHLMYITKVDLRTNQCFWEKGCAALSMSESLARDIVFGLCSNYFRAFMIKVPASVQLKN